MSPRTSSPMTVSEFSLLVDVYGADRTRWPLNARASAGSLLAVDAEARKLLAEAEALAAVLSRASDVGVSNLVELSGRIVANRGDQLGALAGKSNASNFSATSARRGQPVRQDLWPGAALLAASLMVGVLLGQSQLGARAIPAMDIISEITGTGDRLAALDLQNDTIDDD